MKDPSFVINLISVLLPAINTPCGREILRRDGAREREGLVLLQRDPHPRKEGGVCVTVPTHRPATSLTRRLSAILFLSNVPKEV